MYLADSGANAHILVDESMVQNVVDWEQEIKVGGSRTLKSIKKGDLAIKTKNGMCISLLDALIVPDFGKNIVSIGAFIANGTEFAIKGEKATLTCQGRTVEMDKRSDGMYYLEGKPIGMKIEKRAKIYETNEQSGSGNSIRLRK